MSYRDRLIAHMAPLGEAHEGAAVILLAHPQPAVCCDHRMTFFLVNRGGKTYCTMCDPGPDPKITAAQELDAMLDAFHGPQKVPPPRFWHFSQALFNLLTGVLAP